MNVDHNSAGPWLTRDWRKRRPTGFTATAPKGRAPPRNPYTLGLVRACAAA